MTIAEAEKARQSGEWDPRFQWRAGGAAFYEVGGVEVTRVEWLLFRAWLDGFTALAFAMWWLGMAASGQIECEACGRAGGRLPFGSVVPVKRVGPATRMVVTEVLYDGGEYVNLDRGKVFERGETVVVVPLALLQDLVES